MTIEIVKLADAEGRVRANLIGESVFSYQTMQRCPECGEMKVIFFRFLQPTNTRHLESLLLNCYEAVFCCAECDAAELEEGKWGEGLEKRKKEEVTKYIVWASWETVEKFGTDRADYLSDGEALCLGAFDTVQEAEDFINSLPNGGQQDGCPGV